MKTTAGFLNHTKAFLISPSQSQNTRQLRNFPNVKQVSHDQNIQGDHPKIILASQSQLTENLLERASQGGDVFLFLDPQEDPIIKIDGVSVNRLPRSEWFIKPNSSIEQFSRLDPEFPITSAMFEIEHSPPAEVIAWVNIATIDHEIAVRLRIGEGYAHIFGFPMSALDHIANEDLAYMFAVYLTRQRERVKPFGIGIMGYGPFGGMGYLHGNAVQETSGLQLIGAMDANPDRLVTAKADFPYIRTFNLAQDLMTDPDVDVVAIATPPSTHFSLAMEAIRAGKHVVLEKPMCLTTREADTLIDAARNYEISLTVNQNRRWDQDYRAVRKLVVEGLLGEVFNIETFVGGFDHPCRAWHSDEKIAGGAAYDWGAHYIDWILQLYGNVPTQVQAFGHKRKWFEVTNLDQITIRMQFPDGKEATFIQSDLAAARKPKFYIQGTEGTLIGHYRPLTSESVSMKTGYVIQTHHFAEAPAELTKYSYEGPSQIAETSLTLPPLKRYGFWRNFADHLHFGMELAVNPIDVRDVVNILETAHHMSKTSPGANI